MPAVVANAQPVPASRVLDLSRENLLRVAVARGCRHYAGLLPPDTIPDDFRDLSHEVLGAALLRGEADAETFHAIRVGAMVLSDLGNDPRRVCEAAAQFGVTSRLAHVVRLGLIADDHPGFWTAVLDGLSPDSEDTAWLPGVSRLTSETRMAGPNRQPARRWLRTRYPR